MKGTHEGSERRRGVGKVVGKRNIGQGREYEEITGMGWEMGAGEWWEVGDEVKGMMK